MALSATTSVVVKRLTRNGRISQDAENLVYTDLDRVHEIGFEGTYFQVAGPHLSEPSPQRTPVLYQAGTSARGKAFAARHAEGVFLLPRDDVQDREEIADLRALTVQAGRAADHVEAFLGMEIVTATPTRHRLLAGIPRR